MEIEIEPQRDEVLPGRVLISLHRDPCVLLVTRKLEIVAELCSDETLMIVGRRVDEVADNLSGAPFVRSGATAGNLVAHPVQEWSGAVNDLA